MEHLLWLLPIKFWTKIIKYILIITSHQFHCYSIWKFMGLNTILLNRKLDPPKFKKWQSLKTGEFDYRTANKVAFFKWINSKPVFIVSNFHGNGACKIEIRLRGDNKKDFECPVVAKEYKMHMGGVDWADMFSAVNYRNRKSIKWWHRIFFGLLDRALANSFVTYRKMTEDDVISILTFCRSSLSSCNIIEATKNWATSLAQLPMQGVANQITP